MTHKFSICLLILILAPCALGSDEPPTYTLSIKVKSPYNPQFRVCALIQMDLPFQIEWTTGSARGRIVATLHAPKNETYPMSFLIEQSAGTPSSSSQEQGLGLKLEKPEEWVFVASSTFHHYETTSVLLTKTGCQ